MEDAVAAKMLIQGFISGLQICFFLIFIIVAIIDIKNSKKEWKSTDNWIKSIDDQMKFEKCMLNSIDELAKKVLIIENQLDIKDEEEDEEKHE